MSGVWAEALSARTYTDRRSEWPVGSWTSWRALLGRELGRRGLPFLPEYCCCRGPWGWGGVLPTTLSSPQPGSRLQEGLLDIPAADPPPLVCRDGVQGARIPSQMEWSLLQEWSTSESHTACRKSGEEEAHPSKKCCSHTQPFPGCRGRKLLVTGKSPRPLCWGRREQSPQGWRGRWCSLVRATACFPAPSARFLSFPHSTFLSLRLVHSV